MFAGHFGVAAAIKSKTPELPLWSLLVSMQLLDIAFIPFEGLFYNSLTRVYPSLPD